MTPALALVVSLSLPAADPGVEAFLKEDAIEALAVKTLPTRALDRAWRRAPAKSIAAWPQRSVRLLDRKANAALERGPTSISVQAAYDAERVAVRVSWRDDTVDRGGADSAAFGDSVAMELPERFGAGVRLPYIGMGDDEQRALVYLLRAIPLGSRGREYVAAGFGSLTRTRIAAMNGELVYDAAAKSWRAVFVRALDSHGHSIARGVVPIAFAVWDGDKSERGGNKALTSWKVLRLANKKADAVYLKELSWGYGPGELGDPSAGKPLVESMCIACHHVGPLQVAPPGLAPSLQDIGRVATWSYLRDSIVDPSRVVVPNPNKNRHYDRSAATDAHGAYPNSEAFVWFASHGDKKVSKMPPFPLPPDQVANMIAYLKPPPPQGSTPKKESK
jgi:complex iron-sulfur molybdoenzyme family reductase subunit gamma